MTCLDDIPDREDRMKFIEVNGSDAFGKLPQHRQVQPAHLSRCKSQGKPQWLTQPLPLLVSRPLNDISEHSR